MKVSKKTRKLIKEQADIFLSLLEEGQLPVYGDTEVAYTSFVQNAEGERVPVVHKRLPVANIFRRLKRAYIRGGWDGLIYRFDQMVERVANGEPIIDNYKIGV